MTNISEHISYEEATKSQTAIRKGIDNTPTEEQLLNMKHLAQNVFEPIRKHFNRPIGISSFFRSPKLNKTIGGASTSQHAKGEAMDIDADIFGNLTNLEVFKFIRDNLDWDQLIFEGETASGQPEWVHCSLKRNGKNRREVLKAVFKDGKATYIKI